MYSMVRVANRRTDLAEGVEFDFTGRVMPGLETIFTYAYNATEVTEEDDPNFGQTLAGAPEHSASVFARYAFGGDPDSGFSVNGGYVYNSDIEASLPNSIVIPAAGRLDIGAAYSLERWRLGLNINNVLDEKLVRNEPFCGLSASTGYRNTNP